MRMLWSYEMLLFNTSFESLHCLCKLCDLTKKIVSRSIYRKELAPEIIRKVINERGKGGGGGVNLKKDNWQTL